MDRLYKEDGAFKAVEIPVPESFDEELVMADGDELVIAGFGLLQEFLKAPDTTTIGEYHKADVDRVIVCKEGHAVAVLYRRSTHGRKWDCKIETLSGNIRKEFMSVARWYVVLDE